LLKRSQAQWRKLASGGQVGKGEAE
jgi:hypothetical protein